MGYLVPPGRIGVHAVAIEGQAIHAQRAVQRVVMLAGDVLVVDDVHGVHIRADAGGGMAQGVILIAGFQQEHAVPQPR